MYAINTITASSQNAMLNEDICVLLMTWQDITQERDDDYDDVTIVILDLSSSGSACASL